MHDHLSPRARAHHPRLLAGIMTAGVLLVLIPAAAADNTVLEPRDAETDAATIPFSSGTVHGGTTIRANGSLLVTSGCSCEDHRERPIDSRFTAFALLDPTHDDRRISTAAHGEDIDFVMTPGKMLQVDATAATGQTPVLLSSTPLPGRATDLELAPAISTSSEVEIVPDVDDLAGLQVTCCFYYSTDSGSTCGQCSPSECSNLVNPGTPLMTSSPSGRSIWDSYADGVALAGSTPIDVRVNVIGRMW